MARANVVLLDSDERVFCGGSSANLGHVGHHE